MCLASLSANVFSSSVWKLRSQPSLWEWKRRRGQGEAIRRRGRPGGYHLPETSKNQLGGCEDVLAGCLATGWQSSKGKALYSLNPVMPSAPPKNPGRSRLPMKLTKRMLQESATVRPPFLGSQGSQWGIQQNVPRVMDSYKICNSQAFLCAFSYRAPHPTEWATGPPNLDLLLFVVIGITYSSSAGSKYPM